jgi:hypothetical protein
MHAASLYDDSSPQQRRSVTAGWAARAAAVPIANALAAFFVVTVLRRDWRFLAVTVFSCSVATTVATFQYAVFNSFSRASAVIPRTIDADYWVSAATVESFDFPTPFPEDHAAALARIFPDGRTTRVAFGFIPWRSPTGRRGNVALVGIEGLMNGDQPLDRQGFIANRNDLRRLDLPEPLVDGAPGTAVDATVGAQTLHFAGTVDTLSTYLGAPYVLADFETARDILGLGPTDVSFIAGHSGLRDAASVTQAIASLGPRDPEIRVRTSTDFAMASANYWLRKTGAGLAIGLAAILASLLTIILLSNGVLRFIQRYYADLISLLGHGATRADIRSIVAGIAVVVALATFTAALLITPVMVRLFQPLLPWVHFALSDLAAPAAAMVLALISAMVSASGSLARFAPDAVFRT